MAETKHPGGGRCRGCGEHYPRLGDGRCLRCRAGARAEAARLNALCDYVRATPQVTVAEAAAATGVSPARISALIAEGRLLIGGSKEAY